MAANAALAYGRDVRCITDADALFSEATGLDVVVQDAIHRLTTDNIIGPGGDGWGFDTRRLCGAPQTRLNALQPTLSSVLQRDDRILSASVRLTATTTKGLADVVLDVTCDTAQGSFQFVESVLSLTADDIEGQAS